MADTDAIDVSYTKIVRRRIAFGRRTIALRCPLQHAEMYVIYPDRSSFSRRGTDPRALHPAEERAGAIPSSVRK
ncbi:hypothetical protein [Paraburkholderia kirstenboschensis]|uniref:Uncharacterized protein n=1 Tax=Paraburkholderia kirstenboschensis TaxID=1245436 RepID=A0ABZ0ET27_9BURK|nr:hypothetical protein [Paraburkholderia kirstenboschensis]WOD20070.1 hypothetical protein RW095_28140 [Paraburkholderia kirstenboschensis]